MQPKVAAQTRVADPFPPATWWARSNRRSRKRPSAPGGTMHLYVEGASETACGLALDTLTLFPGIDWPGGVALPNPRCGRCGESAAI